MSETKRPADATHFKQTRLAECAVIFAAGFGLLVYYRGDEVMMAVGGLLMFGAAYLRYPILRPLLSRALNALPKFANRPEGPDA